MSVKARVCGHAGGAQLLLQVRKFLFLEPEGGRAGA